MRSLREKTLGSPLSRFIVAFATEVRPDPGAPQSKMPGIPCMAVPNPAIERPWSAKFRTIKFAIRSKTTSTPARFGVLMKDGDAQKYDSENCETHLNDSAILTSRNGG